MRLLIILTAILTFTGNIAADAQDNTTSQNEKIIDTLEQILQKENSNVATFLAKSYRNDKEMISLLIQIDGTLIKHAGVLIRNDKEIALKAVKQNGLAIKFLSSALKRDRKIILEAGKENIEALQFVRVRPKGNRDLIKEILQNSKQINNNDYIN